MLVILSQLTAIATAHHTAVIMEKHAVHIAVIPHLWCLWISKPIPCPSENTHHSDYQSYCICTHTHTIYINIISKNYHMIITITAICNKK